MPVARDSTQKAIMWLGGSEYINYGERKEKSMDERKEIGCGCQASLGKLCPPGVYP